MPIYEYEPNDGNCEQCGGRFEVLQGMREAALTECPDCGKPCHRVISAFATIKDESNLLSSKNLQRHGFTRYERTGDEKFEKTLGTGPDTLGGD